jgi:MFS-type transporter involved in bile tolerance (Atg22 family)
MTKLFAGNTVGDILRIKAGSDLSESFGFILHAFARAPLPFVFASFYGPYLTMLAKFQAYESAPFDQVSWLGIKMRASSYVAVYTTAHLLFSAIISPFLGSFSDATPYR